MHADLPSGSPPSSAAGPWYREMNRYHWFVMVVAALGWLFDCLDQQLFVLARPAAMKALLPKGFDSARFDKAADEILAQAPTTLDKSAVEGLVEALRNRSPEISYTDQFAALLAGLPKQLADVGRDAEPAKKFEEFDKSVRQNVESLTHETASKVFGGYATSIFLLGWATGGLFFGVLGDRIGRAKTMLITVLLYSGFTGLSSISKGFWDFAVYRFLTGLGVGGEFAVGVALVAEVMPDRARPFCLTLLQMLSALGNVTAAAINMSLGVMEEHGLVESPWRKMFLIGAVPALLALVIRAKLKEPERWQKMRHDDALQKQLGSYRELFRHPTWRRHAVLGLLLASAGVIGLWAIGFFAPDLSGSVLRRKITERVFVEQAQSADAAKNTDRVAKLEELQEAMAAKKPIAAALKEVKADVDKAISGRITFWSGVTSIMIQLGAFCGMFGFGVLSHYIGRKPTFVIAFIAAFASTASFFWFLSDFHQLFWLNPIMGFCQLSLFAGYAIYFPELFPTHLRSTGTSFCYNVGRFIAATGPLVQGALVKYFASVYGGDSLRYAGVTMCVVFLLGLVALPFLPETRGKPLPE